MEKKICRFCGKTLSNVMIDLGHSPLANEFLTEESKVHGQYWYPLVVDVCEECFLVQARVFEKKENIFSNYAYFSSYSDSWLQHCKKYVEEIIPRLGLGSDSTVLEIACNDGYLLQYFKPYNIKVKGIDPAVNVIEEARKKNIEVQCDFFNLEVAQSMKKKGEKYNLIIGNNVLAHTPEINSFVAGLSEILDKNGTITMEFPHLLSLIRNTQFDTIYHEHFSYFSLYTILKIFEKHKLKIYDVDRLSTHGGSIRIYATHIDCERFVQSNKVKELLALEIREGICDLKTYKDFSRKAKKIKIDTLELFSKIIQQEKRIAAFGAAAKGNTFLNYCGIDTDIIEFVVDSNKYKQGRYTPGSLIPIMSLEQLRREKPDYVLILPWNLTDEVVNEISYIREWNGKFITCIPEIKIF